MAYANTRPDSPKGRVFKAYSERGEAAAITTAKRLEIVISRAKRWFKEWREAGSRPARVAEGVAKLRVPDKAKKSKAPAKKKAPEIKASAKKKTTAKRSPPKAKPEPESKEPEPASTAEETATV